MKYLKLLLFAFLLPSSYIYAQKDSIPLNTILEKKGKLFNDYPLEKVHLHFDKPYYSIGDTIWFKAYVTLEQRSLSPLSKILYVDIISAKDSLVESLKIPVTNSVSDGNIVLYSPKYKQGTYQLRAYTKWMLNFDPTYFFSKNMVIGDAVNKDLFTNISFDGTRNDKGAKINARILYKDEKGIPLMNKKVSWEVVADFERVARGKGTTDGNGYLDISFNASSKVDINGGQLSTSLETGNIKPLTATFPLKTAILENDIQFFPEGGELIAGIPSKVAFKAITSNGLGTDAKVSVIDKTGKNIVEVSAQHVGMGLLQFTPEDGNEYKAKVTFKDGSLKTFGLPPVKSEGMNISVSQDQDNIFLKINANDNYFKKNINKGFYIIAQSTGIVYYAAQSTLKTQSFNAEIPKNKFPSGILQISLIAANGLPISERLVFIRRNDLLDIKVSSDLNTYSGRQKVKLNISARNSEEASEGNYSIAVIDESKVPSNEDTETTILSNLLLNSDLAGYIEKPNYYFNKPDNKKDQDLDLLMLTQGYRKFLYKDIVENKLPKINYLPEQGIDITGTIRRANGMTWPGARLVLQIPDRHFNAQETTDKEGKFRFSNVVFRDSSEVIINARNNVNSAKDIRIMVDGEPYPAIYSNVNKPDEILNIDSTLNTYLKNAKLQYGNAFMLKEVVVKANAVEKKPSHLDHSSLSGLNMMADRVTSSEQLQGCANLLNCLSGSGITYMDNTLYLTRNYNQGNRTPIEVYVNGMPVDVNYLASIDANGVESIEVFNNDGLSGINRRTNTQGVLVVNLKEIKKTTISKDQLKELFPPANILTYTPKGYSVERQFYAPKYSGPRAATQPEDLRTTIFWSPIVNTDKDGKTSLEYFNGDGKGTYKVVVEGIDRDGNIGRGIYRYQVK